MPLVHASRQPVVHLSHRANWLRAAVLGANDGIVSTASLVLGVAASGASNRAVLTAGIAGLVGGALSMATGEYVSVSSQLDSERADLRLEEQQLSSDPRGELRELSETYQRRGLSPALAGEVARELSRGDALATHAREELGLTEKRLARPLQAAWASALAFSTGAAIPLIAVSAPPAGYRISVCVVVSVLALVVLGDLGARLGGAPRLRAAARVLVWGALAMGITAGIGVLIGTV